MTGPTAGPPAGPPQPFDVCGSLPRGVTVLEASAGTGKTFTIAALAARYVAAGVPLERLMLVTFTRMATGELRERVRSRLVSAELGLARIQTGRAGAGDDEVLGHLADGSAEVVEERRRRLASALADFDAATIDTTHGFCQRILSGLGVAGDVEPDLTFVEDLSDLVEEVVDDLYVLRFFRDGSPPFGRKEALAIAAAAIDHPKAWVEPEAAAYETAWAMRRRFALKVRKEVELRKRRARVITYDDLLTRLADAVSATSERGAAACRRLRERYQVALVDEFQDTDPIQWEIMRRAFAEGGESTLVLIGDPKQAIYSFRGADVYAYLQAARIAGTHATLGVNWRSDQGLVTAYDALFAGSHLGHPDIAYAKVEAAPAHQSSRLLGAPRPAPLRVRVVHREDGVALTREGYVQVNAGRRLVAHDVAADLVALLSAGAEVLRPARPGTGVGHAGPGSEADAPGAREGVDGPGSATGAAGADAGPARSATAGGGAGSDRREPLRPGHVAVLVRTHKQAALVRDALEAVRIPAVINGAGSVLDTPVARQWLVLLEALERPASAARAKAAALTCFLGWTVEQLAAAGEHELEQLHGRLQAWATVLRRRGVASLLETATHSGGVPARLLAREDGERQLTDLRHVGQLLHAEAVAEGLGVTALAAWLRQRIAEAGEDTTSEERSRRLESDAEAVQILTIHRSKGLEFPVVYCPFLWDMGFIHKTDNKPALYHDPASDDRHTVHVGMGGGPGFSNAWRQYVEEQRGEDLRLAYVALTRAQHQAVVWWAGSWDSRNSPLGRLLFGRDAEGNVDVELGAVPSDDEVVDYFAALARRSGGQVSVERAGAGGPAGATLALPVHPPAELGVRPFARALDVAWRRTSYSGITAGGHDAVVASEPEQPVLSDEAPVLVPAGSGSGTGAGPQPFLPRNVAPGSGIPLQEGAGGGDGDEEAGLRAVLSPLAAMPAGAEVGTLVHAVLEHADFTAPDLGAELTTVLAEERAWREIDVGEPAMVVAGLQAAIETPLGRTVGDARLRDVGRAHRLQELAFELPLVGGDQPRAGLALGAVADLLRAHLPAGDPLAGYPDRLADPGLQRDLRGYLAGSIDLVLRLPAPAGEDGHRFAIVDHKTNRLGPPGPGLSAWHYRPEALVPAMEEAHYPLQALLYSVALHRYLRWRLPGYDPERNLAGVLYLFLRGMTGADVPRVGGQPCGVFGWRPPARLIAELSDLFDRGGVGVAA